MSGSIAAVLDYLDKVDPEAAARRARALRLPDAVAEGARDLRPRGAHGRLSQMRAGGRSPSAGSCCSSGSTTPRQDGESFLDAAQNARLVASAERYYRDHVLRRRRVLEPARHPHVRDARASAGGARPAGRRRWSGRTTPTSATRATPTWAQVRERAEHRPALPRALRRRGGADRLRHAHRHGGGGHRLGRRHGGQARAAVASRQLRAALPRRRRCRASCSTSAGDQALRRGCSSRGSSASSA